MTFNDYQELAKKTAIYPMEHKLTYPALGLVEEAGEVAGKVKKMLRDKPYLRMYIMTNSRPDSPQMQAELDELVAAIKKELGDVLWYVSATCTDFNLTMEEVAKANYEKLKDRQERGKLGGSGDNR